MTKNFICIAICLSMMAMMNAATISASFVRNESGLGGIAIDESTGIYYTKNYSAAGSIKIYSNASNFAGNVYTTVNLGTNNMNGNYFAAQNGKLYGRTDGTTSAVAKWNAGTGALEAARSSIPDLGGINGTHSFNWGGNSAVNWFYDGNDLYLLGKCVSNTNIWQLNRMDANLNVIETKTFTESALGYAFMINGKLFAASTFTSNTVDRMFNFATGQWTSISHTFSGLSGGYYTDGSYDAVNDILYITNWDGIYKVNNASVAFNAMPINVPEPATMILFALALGVTANALKNFLPRRFPSVSDSI